MRIVLIIFFSLLLSYSGYSQQTVTCTIKTTQGEIVVQLLPDKAPKTVSNFLKYVDGKLYDNSSFFRVCTPENEAERKIKIEVIQGGNVPEERSFDPIEMESTNQTGIKHLNGTISMARAAPNSATSSFFICINDQPELDFGGKRNPDGQGFAAFGTVIKGMDVVKKIQKGEQENQYLVNPVKILGIVRSVLK